MTNEEKQLLLKDLCARLPYGVICHYNCVIPSGKRVIGKANARDVLKGIIPIPDGHIGFMVGIDKVNALEGDIKPYLRPMSSMTDKEKEELRREFGAEFRDEDNGRHTETYGYVIVYHNFKGESWYIPFEAIDWLNARHFDYRELIPKGLALEAPKDMYENVSTSI